MKFLRFRPESSLPVLSFFAKEKGAISHFDGEKNNFVYIPGKRSDRVLLIAHADTVWDDYYIEKGFKEPLAENSAEVEHNPVIDSKNIISQGGSEKWGIGADDRAGCAMLWLLKDSGHSLLITDGEEHGQLGAHHLMNNYPEIADEINSHSYMLQLDRRNGNDYKTYNIPVSDEFRSYIENNTGYADAGSKAGTDIVALCRKICGANMSIGYRCEHRENEILNIKKWTRTYKTVKALLEKPQPRFPLAERSEKDKKD